MGIKFKIIRIISRLHSYIYWVSRGKLGRTLGGQDILFLTTVGRKSGKKRTVPLAAIPYGDKYILIASFGGSPVHPSWFRNIQENRDVQIQVGSITRQTIASIIESHDGVYDGLWGRATAMYSGFENYRKATLRQIPIVLVGDDDAL